MSKRFIYLIVWGVATLLGIWDLSVDKAGFSLIGVVPIWCFLTIVLLVLFFTAPLRRQISESNLPTSTKANRFLFSLLGGLGFGLLGVWIERLSSISFFSHGLVFFLLMPGMLIALAIIGYSLFHFYYQRISRVAKIGFIVLTLIFILLSFFFLFTRLGTSILSVLFSRNIYSDSSLWAFP